MARIEVFALPTDRRVEPGDDLAALIVAAAVDAGVELADGDVVCVASKVVSKAEGAYAELPAAPDVHTARRRLAEREAARVVAETPWVLVVETRHGYVCANAGIDTSNVAGGRALLLPADPDAAAAGLRAQLVARAGVRVGVLVTDTFGRPWRMGQTDVALGAAGVVALRDERGTTDLEGRELEVTMVAVADELAAAADLARRKADGTPFVLIRGAEVGGDGRGADLVRPAAEDVFRHGGARAVEAAVLAPQEPPWPAGEWTATVTERAIVATAGPTFGEPVDPAGPHTAMVTDLGDDPPAGCEDDDVVLGVYTDGSPARLVWAGVAAERARLVLAAHGLATRWLTAGDGADVPAAAPPAGPSPVRTTDGATVDLAAATAGLRLTGVLAARLPPATSTS